MHIRELEYELPEELIAQQPIEPRDHARLLVCDRATRTHQHRRFYELPELLAPGDLLVANDTRVINARLRGRKPTGGKVEVLLVRQLDALTWQALVGGRNVQEVIFDEEMDLRASVIAREEGPLMTLRFSAPIELYLERVGEVPLPPTSTSACTTPSVTRRYARVAGALQRQQPACTSLSR